jgi:DNA transformation protein
MTVSKGFADFVVEHLDGCGPITAKRMFGGVGLYREDVFFGIIDDDVLYLKVGDANRADYQRAKSDQFEPYGDGRASFTYYSVPVSVLEDPRELTAWAKKSIAAAIAAKAPPKRKRPTPRRRT